MARVSRETAAAHRRAMVAAASRLIRLRGIDGVGVAEVTREAGLTHGGFYGHFASKDALVAEAIVDAFAEGRARLESLGLDDYLRGYLSRHHRDHPESGCPIPGLAAEAGRGAEPLKRVFSEGIANLTAELADRLDGDDAAKRQERAAAIVALLIGGLTLARTTCDVDASDRLLRALRAQVIALAGRS